MGCGVCVGCVVCVGEGREGGARSLHVQVREETATLSHVRQLLYDYLRAGTAHGYCNQCGAYGHKKPDCAGRNKFFNGTCNKCGAHGHKTVDCPVKMVAHLESESVTEPNEEPAESESLE